MEMKKISELLSNILFYILFSMLTLIFIFVIIPQNSKSQETQTRDVPSYLSTMGEQLIYLKQYDEALAYYDKYIKTNPNDIIALYNIAALSHFKHNYKDALIYIDRALRLRNQFPRAWFLKGQILVRLDDLHNRELTQERKNIIRCFENSLTTDFYVRPPSNIVRTVAYYWLATIKKQADPNLENFSQVNELYSNVVDCIIE